MQEPFEKGIHAYRGIKSTVAELDNLYHSVVGGDILWRSFASVSRSSGVVLDRCISMHHGVLFEIHLHTRSVVAYIHGYSRYPNELEVLIAV
jgi:hypothetical protein